MKKNLFEINSEEVQRILSLHESRTKSQYLTEAVTSSFKLTNKIDIKSTGDDDNGEKNSLRLPMGTTFTVKNIGNLISNLVNYEMVKASNQGENVVGMGTGQIRYNCQTQRFKITDKNMSFQSHYYGQDDTKVRTNLKNVCAYSDSETYRAADAAKTVGANTKVNAAASFETIKANSLAALKNYPCLNVTNGLQYVYATNGLHFYQNANFRYRGNGTKQSTSIPMRSDGNVQDKEWVKFDCATDFPGTAATTNPTVGANATTTNATNTQQVNRQQVNGQQFAQRTVTAINNVQKTLKIPQTGQLKNSDIDALLNKLK